MLTLLKEDFAFMSARTLEVIDLLFDGYADTIAAIGEENGMVIRMSGEADGLVTNNPYQFFFDNDSSSIMVTYPKGENSVLDLEAMQPKTTALNSLARTAIENVYRVKKADGENLITKKFWDTFKAKTTLDIDTSTGEVVVTAKINTLILQVDYEDTVMLLNTLQCLVHLLDTLIERSVYTSINRMVG